MVQISDLNYLETAKASQVYGGATPRNSATQAGLAFAAAKFAAVATVINVSTIVAPVINVKL
ncbi:MAG: hypothetical protein KME64_23045 [Scytonematopsis contorta HA4267-MV1]|jgi:hypothetical protein|nr:hypothetical protein [Scytonematopsis contorta HA4267-MV1]